MTNENEMVKQLNTEGLNAEWVYYDSFGTHVLHVNNIAFQTSGLNYMNELTMGKVTLGKEKIKQYCKQKQLLVELYSKQKDEFEYMDSMNNYVDIGSAIKFVLKFYPQFNNFILKEFGGEYNG